MRVITRALLLWCLFFAPAAWSAHPTDANSPPSALYHNYCSVCHGDRGDGDSRAKGSLKPPPRDFTTPLATTELTRARMIAAVKGGVPGTAMVGWGAQLSDKQIEAVVDYVRDTFMRPATMADSSRGRQLYARICSVCHGDRGGGSVWASANLKPAPRDFTAAGAELTREKMLIAVAGGRPGTAMSAYAPRLSQADIEAVVDYVRGAFMGVGREAGISGTHAHGAPTGEAGAAAAASPHAVAPAPAPAAPPSPPLAKVQADMSLPMPKGLVGDATAGKKFYDANCATCHGVKGDGKGPRAYFINPKPRVFIAPEARATFNRPALFAAVSAGSLGSEMPAWDKVLDPQQIANVSEYVFQAFMAPGTVKAAARKP
ncbi:cytochrome c553 [Burkholderiales bacterium JOSHI_001]|nr:cytochrome c553 [Burkholderiales bacterium JOSHI_001]